MDYFELNIIYGIPNRETIKEAWDIALYSVQRNIISEHTGAPVTMVGYFWTESRDIRRKEAQTLLDGIPGLTVNWNAVQVGKVGLLASDTDYRAFLAVSTMDKDCADSNQNLKIRVDVRGISYAVPKK